MAALRPAAGKAWCPVDASATRASLLSRLRDPADDGAWREFEARYGDLIVRYARARGLKMWDAEDVRQVVMLSLSRALPTFRYARDRGRFRTYLGRAVRHAVARAASSRGARPERLDTDGRALRVGAPDDVDATWEREWMNHHLRVAMAEIRRTFAAQTVEVFDRLIAGVPAAALAREYGMTIEAIYKARSRIGQRLRELVERQVRAEDGTDG